MYNNQYDKSLDSVFYLLKELVKNKFYGELLLKFEYGKIKIGKKTESIKFDK